MLFRRHWWLLDDDAVDKIVVTKRGWFKLQKGLPRARFKMINTRLNVELESNVLNKCCVGCTVPSNVPEEQNLFNKSLGVKINTYCICWY